LTGPNGLLMGLGRRVVQAALEAEMTRHLGYEWHDAVGDGSGSTRNGFHAKTVHTEAGDPALRIPPDRAGTFEPVLVPEHSRRLPGFDENVLDLYAKGLTTGGSGTIWRTCTAPRCRLS
jgi:transposase-like protein